MQALGADSSLPGLSRVYTRGIVVTSHYFFRYWKPRLGPVPTLLILELRDRCYRDARTGKQRSTCWPSQAELARSLGVSVDTIARALKHDLAKKFIRVEPRYRYDPHRRRKIRTSSVYHVALDGPPLSEDAVAASTPHPADQEGSRKVRQEKRNEKIIMNVEKKTARDQEHRVEYLGLHLATQLGDEKKYSLLSAAGCVVT